MSEIENNKHLQEFAEELHEVWLEDKIKYNDFTHEEIEEMWRKVRLGLPKNILDQAIHDNYIKKLKNKQDV